MTNIHLIPSVDEIMKKKEIKALVKQYNRNYVVSLIRENTDKVRQQILREDYLLDQSRDEICRYIINLTIQTADDINRGSLIPVINGTGVVLHTNLGRAPLGKKALSHVVQVAPSYSNLEMDLNEGIRGSRHHHIEKLLCRLTGAEAALVVNNNAAAVLLGLHTFAHHKEVVVSRGQLIEIGGSFRIPEIMKLSNAVLREVGTTNKTYARDFTEAINEDTGLLFSAHTSNYKIVGFTQEVAIDEMVSLGEEYGIPVMQDLGSGVLFDLSDYGLREEPLVQESVKAGVDIITFSGDKLLGGPQAGIIIGKKRYIDPMKHNQMLRALRVDKLVLAALEGTLLEYLSGLPQDNIPVLAMLSKTEAQLMADAQDLLDLLHKHLDGHREVQQISLNSVEDMVGGGAYPSYVLPGYGVEIRFTGNQLEDVSRYLRHNTPAILTRKQEGGMLISARTLQADDQNKIVQAICSAVNHKWTDE